MNTLKEIANEFAKKQPKMVDSLTRSAPILAKLKWIGASHKLWNAAEKITDIQGASFVELNAQLPVMDAATDIVQVPVFNLGGEFEVTRDKADQFGGASQYFAKYQELFLKKSGMDTETKLYENFFLKGAIAGKNIISAGGTAASGDKTGLSHIVVIRLDEASNTGIFDPTQFNQGRLLNVNPTNGGNVYHLRTKPGVLGYGVNYIGRFGWQSLAPEKTLAAIVNINKSKKATQEMLNEAIAMVEGSTSDTMIFAHPLTVAQVFPEQKMQVLQMGNNETNLNTVLTAFNGIPIVSSYNINSNNAQAIA